MHLKSVVSGFRTLSLLPLLAGFVTTQSEADTERAPLVVLLLDG